MLPPFIEVAVASPVGIAAQRAGTTFLEEEAGISAYTNLGQEIDLKLADDAFRTIEYETDEYIIGSVPLPDYAETEDVHAYIHKDGWIVTYYLNEEPVAKILDWADYNTDEKINSTKLEDGISVVCDALNISVKNVKYYDFRYPNADKLMIIGDALWAAGTDTFNITLPGDFVFYELSYPHSNRAKGPSNMYIDEEAISGVSEGKTNYGQLSPSQLSPDVPHTIKLWARERSGSVYTSPQGYPAFDAIVLVYREA